MTPERKAELRRLGDYQHDLEWRGPFASKFLDAKPAWNEMLDEIDRLEGLVRSGHVHHLGLAFGDTLHGGCSCGFPIETSGRGAKDKHAAIHAAHVEAILRADT